MLDVDHPEPQATNSTSATTVSTVVRTPRNLDEARMARILVAMTIGVWAVSRAVVVSSAVIPKGPDVIGPWAVAFWVSGSNPAIDMGTMPPYSVATGALLAPLVPAVHDPRIRYQVAIVMIGVLVLGGSWLVARTARRLFDLGPLATTAAFSTATLLTTVAFGSSFSWAEGTSLVWLCAFIALASYAIGSPSSWPSVAVAVFGGTAILFHGRLVGVAGAWVLAVAVAAIADVRFSRRSIGSAAVLVGSVCVTTATAYLVAKWFRQVAVDAAWSNPTYDGDTAFVGMLGEGRYWVAVAKATVGQLWYVVASTAGLAAVGAWALMSTALRPHETDRTTRGSLLPYLQRRTAMVILLCLAAVAATCIMWVAPALTRDPMGRPDYLIYGRYIDPVAVVLAAFGGAAVIGRAARSMRIAYFASIAMIGVGGIALRVVRDNLPRASFAVNEGVIAGVAAWPLDRAGVDVIRWSVLGVAAGAVILAATFTNKKVAACALTSVLILGCAAGTQRAAMEHRAWDNSVLFDNYPEADPGANEVAMASDARNAMAYNYNAPSQQYALAPLGWNITQVEMDSAQLAAKPPEDAAMMVLGASAGVPDGSWCHMPPYDRILVWARLDVVLPGEVGGACSLG